MGAALLQGVLAAGVCRAEDVVVHDREMAAAVRLAEASGVRVAEDNGGVAAASDVVLLCIKPAAVPSALAECAADLAEKLVVSIAAGVTLSTLQSAAGASCRVVRVMPNTGVLVGQGAAAYATGAGVTPSDIEAVEKIFSATGSILPVEEGQLDAVTGLSGSGPAYIYLVIESLTDGGVRMGLPHDLAQRLAVQTVAGAAAMVAGTGQTPAALREMVTSPGGTTVAGLAVLERDGLREALMGAVQAATLRAKELGGA